MSDERELLRETVAALVAKHASPAAVREAMESERGYDESLWRLLCEQVGAAALVVPEEFGGAGGTLGDAAVVLEELGKGLVPSPLLGTTLAELALLAADEPDADALGSLAEGAAIGAVVFDRGYVVNGDIADIVIAADDGKLDRWTEFGAEARPLHGSDPPAGPASLRRTRRRWARIPVWPTPRRYCWPPSRSARATRCLELTVDYTKERQQFGRPIGSFQALKHRMADLYVAVQAARAVVNDAADAPSATSAALARVAATEAFSTVAAEGIQLHGGIAITWEHDMQLYFKRAHGSSQLLGPAARSLAPAGIRSVLAVRRRCRGRSAMRRSRT